MKIFRLILVVVVISSICLTGCQENEIINDPETGEITTDESSDFQDGEYQAATRHFDERGYGQVITLSIRDGIITVVKFNEINLDGENRLWIEGPETTWDELTPLNLDSLYFKLYSDLLLNQRSSQVNAISGATQTSRTFILLAQFALNQSIAGNTETTYLDTTNTYVVYSSNDAENFQGVMTATYSGETLSSLYYDEISTVTGELKSQSNDINPNMDYSLLFRSFTEITLENQNLNSIFNGENIGGSEKKYEECLNQLQLIRVNFIAP
ncbi:hypothetical protein Q5O24_07430 [Eubacteriaceae bacterium ES3]|nr:hypothetical protein Q5O24_07430 [Eubacteriaceae bacterium ES3]